MVLAHVDDDRGSILEIGCGRGRMTLVLAREFDRVVALDVSPSAVALCREACASCAPLRLVALGGRVLLQLRHPRRSARIPDMGAFLRRSREHRALSRSWRANVLAADSVPRIIESSGGAGTLQFADDRHSRGVSPPSLDALH